MKAEYQLPDQKVPFLQQPPLGTGEEGLSCLRFHSIMESWRWEGTYRDHLVHPPAQSRVSENRMLRAVSSWFLIYEIVEITSLGNLCQC